MRLSKKQPAKVLLGAAILSLGVASAAPAASRPGGIPKFPLAPGRLAWKGAANPRRFIHAVGEASGIWGFENGALEGWVYPLKLFHDFQLSFQLAGSARVYSGRELAASARVFPQMAELQYSAEAFTVREILFAPRRAPGFVILLDVDTPRPLRITLRFKPDLNLMWPAGLGGQSYDWDAGRHWLRLSEPSGRFSALIGSPFAVTSSAAGYAPYLTSAHPNEAMVLRVTPGEAQRYYVPIIAAAGIRGHYHAAAAYRELLNDFPEFYAASRRHYMRLERRGPQFLTPEAEINAGMRWSRVALDQLYVCNPYLGCGYVSGYGSSGTGARPMYAWYFDEPAITAAAFLDDGDIAGLKQAVEFLAKYQRADGAIPHEISQSAGLIAWFRDYPYPYIHPDSTLWYLIAMGRIYRFTGDRAFARRTWPQVRKAYQSAVSRLDPADGLPVIPKGDWGSIELAGFRKDAAMAGEWIAALRGVRELARLAGDRALARECELREKQAAASLEREFWNPQTGFYNYGLFRSGKPVTYLNPAIGTDAWLGSLPRERAQAVLKKLVTASFLADWGERNMSLADPRYREGSYHIGSAWPFLTAAPMLAEFQSDQPAEAMLMWRSMLQLRNFDAPGDLPEALSGSYYRLLDEGVPHQMFSELTAVPGLVEGVMGLDLDVPRNALRWRPHLPPSWPWATVRDFPYGKERMNFSLRQAAAGQLEAKIQSSGRQAIRLDYSPALPMGSKVIAVVQDGRAARFTVRTRGGDLHVHVQTTFFRSTDIAIRYRPGIALEAEWLPLLAGDRSRNIRILQTRYQPGRLELTVEGRPGQVYKIRAYTPWRLARIAGVRIVAGGDGYRTLELRAPKGRRVDAAGYIRWQARLRMQSAHNAPLNQGMRARGDISFEAAPAF